jgi:excisionase family DNA binding protein
MARRIHTDPPLADPLLTVEDLAALLGVAARTLDDWRQRGCGPRYISMSRRAVRYRKSDVDAWLGERCRASTTAA